MSMGEAGKQEEKPQENYAEFLNNEFVGDIVKELNLDVSEGQIQDILSGVKKSDEEKKKKEEEDKK